MNLDFSPEEIAFRDEVRTFITENYPKELAGVGTREDLTRDEFLAWQQDFGQKRLVRARVARGSMVARAGHRPRDISGRRKTRVSDAIMPLPFGVVSMVARRHLHIRHRGAEERIPARDQIGRRVVVARAIPSPAQDRTLPASRRRLFATATSGSSMARRPGQRLHNLPTGDSSSAVPTRRRKSLRKVSASSW